MRQFSITPLDVPVYPLPPAMHHMLDFIVSMDGCDIYRMQPPPYVKALNLTNWRPLFVVHYRRSRRAYAEYSPTYRRWVVQGRSPDKSPHPRPKEISQRVETYIDALIQLTQ